MKKRIAIYLVVGLTLAAVAWIVRERMALRRTGGPMVQAVTQDGMTIVWQVNQSGSGEVQVLDGERVARTIPARFEHGRFVARVDGLKPGQTCRYRVVLKQVGSSVVFDEVWTARTNPGPDSDVRFIAFGDSGTGGAGQYRLGEGMPKHKPDVVIHTGDLVYPDGERDDYVDNFFMPYADLLPSALFMPSVGNHDDNTDEAAPLLEVFELPENGPEGTDPERHYWFDWGRARFVALDSTVGKDEIADKIAPWIEKVFADAGPRWRFVYFHHPPYTGCYKHPPAKQIVKGLVPSFERSLVDIVFCGHNHLYERTLPLKGGKVVDPREGVIYIVTGAGGAALYPEKPEDERPAYVAVAYDKDYSFTLVDARASRLELQQIGIDGTLIDRYTLERGPRSSLVGKATTEGANAR